MSTTRQITLTENPDGRWTAYDTATEQVSQGRSPEEALENLDDAAGADTDSDHAADRGDDNGPPPTIAKAINTAEESDCEAGAPDENPVNPDDPIFSPTTFTAGKPTDTSERIDEVLYGAEDAHE